MSAEAPTFSPEILAKHNEITAGLDHFVEGKLDLLLDPGKAWQPADRLILDDADAVRVEASRIPPSLLIVFVGNTITEEGLPLFTSAIASYPFGQDIDGKDENGWAKWKRGWASEEQRHEFVSNRYLSFVPGVNLQNIEEEVHRFLGNGFAPGGRLDDAYSANMYTSWQERATQEAHRGVSELAKQLGAPKLAEISGVMAGDEGRHAKFYKAVVAEIFRIDPEGAMLSFNNVSQRGLVMPGVEMPNFRAFVEMSSMTGVYDPRKYLEIFEELIKEWDIEHIAVEGNAGQAQEQILDKHRKLKRVIGRLEPPKPKEIDSPWLNTKSTLIAEGQLELLLRT